MGVRVRGRAYVLVRVLACVQAVRVYDSACRSVRADAFMRARVRALARANARDGRARVWAHVGVHVYVRVGA